MSPSPRPERVTIVVDGQPREIESGTSAESLLPTTVGDSLVVAALLDYKAVSLSCPITSSGTLEPLSLAHWEGERIYRHSVALLVLEAAHDVAPGLTLRMGASVGNLQWIEVDPLDGVDLTTLANRVTARLRQLIDRFVAIYPDHVPPTSILREFIGGSAFEY